MKKLLLLVLLFELISFTTGERVEAKTVSWNTQLSNTFFYCYYGTDMFGQQCPDKSVQYWARALKDTNVTINYGAVITNLDTGASVNDGSIIPVGTHLRLTTTPHVSTDISWFGTGYSQDSPNGNWVAGAAAPTDSTEVDFPMVCGINGCSGGKQTMPVCHPRDFVSTYTSPAYTSGNTNVPSVEHSVYIPLQVDPPAAKTISTSANLSCNAASINSSKTITQDCTVTSTGAISVTFNIPSTTGKFYYRYRAGDTSGEEDDHWCSGNQTALRSGTSNSSLGGDGAGSIAGSDYVLNVPTKAISFSMTASTANALPNPPSITGPTTGSPNADYTFTFQASDPDNDTLRYGIDWDNNNSVDQWIPASGYVASNISQSGIRQWPTVGAKTFKALTEDSNGGTSSWSAPFTITLANAPAPALNFTINDSLGPLNVAQGSNLNLVWSATNVSSCTGYGAGWHSGEVIGISGNDTIAASASDNYVVNCTGSYGDVSKSITVNLVNTLKVCQNSCSSGILRGSTGTTRSFTLAEGGSQNLVACFNSASNCSDNSGNVTASTNWSENTSSNVVTLSGSDPKTVTGNTSGSENISATYSSQTTNMTVNVTCVPSASCATSGQGGSYCQHETYTIDNGCGVTLTCNGSRSCDANWKEVAP